MQTRRLFIAGLCPILAMLSLTGCFISPVTAADKLSCNDAVHQANQELEQQNDKPIYDEATLTKLIRTLNKDEILPANYVTSNYAISQGWSGKPNESLWSVWVLNKKTIGGDRIQNPELEKGVTWYSADLESVRGMRGAKRLIYSPQSETRYLTSNENKSRVIIQPCH